MKTLTQKIHMIIISNPPLESSYAMLSKPVPVECEPSTLEKGVIHNRKTYSRIFTQHKDNQIEGNTINAIYVE